MLQVNLDIEMLLNSLNISYNSKNEIFSPLRQKIQLYIIKKVFHIYIVLVNGQIIMLNINNY